MAKRPPKKTIVKRFEQAASNKGKRVHIVPSKDGWSVKKEGSKRSSSVQPTKERAVKAARELKSVERVVIHKKDGTISRNSKKK